MINSLQAEAVSSNIIGLSPLSSSCRGLQSVLHICNEFRKSWKWDIHFNAAIKRSVSLLDDRLCQVRHWDWIRH